MAPSRPVFEIRAPLGRADLPGLYARACARLICAAGGELVVNVAAVDADGVAVEALARLALAARRHGCAIRLQGAGEALCQLIDLMGLAAVLGTQSSRGGSPKSGNTRSVSRKNVNSTSELPSSSST